MVATSMHYIVGIFLAWFLGYKDNRKYLLGLIAVIPDIDGILMAILLAGRGIFGYSLDFMENSVLGVILFAHRGISHSLFLLAAALVLLVVFRKDKKIIQLVSILWLSHLFLDFITAWKFFPFLPLSFFPAYFGLVEVFDSILVFSTTIMLGFFVGHSLLNKEKQFIPMLAYLFVLGLGFLPSVFMREYNTQTLILSQLGFWLIVTLCFVQNNKKHRKVFVDVTTRGIKFVSIFIIGYLSVLLLNKLAYAGIVGTNPINVEPLEQFAFNYNSHTYEIDKGDYYDMGIISWKGVEKKQQVRKIRNNFNVASQEEIDSFVSAYPKSLHMNWLNHPVYTFQRDSEGVLFANIRYAKSFLDTPYGPGPQGGIDVVVNDAGILVSHGDGWFD